MEGAGDVVETLKQLRTGKDALDNLVRGYIERQKEAMDELLRRVSEAVKTQNSLIDQAIKDLTKADNVVDGLSIPQQNLAAIRVEVNCIGRNPKRSTETPSTPEYIPILQNLLTHNTWRDENDVGRLLRRSGSNRLRASPEPSCFKADTFKREKLNPPEVNDVDNLLVLGGKGFSEVLMRPTMNMEILKRAKLIGRDDHFFIKWDESSGCFCSEILYCAKGESPLLEKLDMFVDSSSAKECAAALNKLLDWIEDQFEVNQIPGPRKIGSDNQWYWNGDFSTFDISPLPGDYGRSDIYDKRASMRFISQSAVGKEKISDEIAKLKSSAYFNSWYSIYQGNGMWKAEVVVDLAGSRRNSFQKSLKQSSYPRGQVEVMSWVLKRCAELNIHSFRYKSRAQEFLVRLAGWLAKRFLQIRIPLHWSGSS